MNIFNISFQYLNSNQQTKLSKKNSSHPAFTSAVDTFAREAADAVSGGAAENLSLELVNKVLNIFKNSADKAPLTINLKVSPSSGQIMGFSIPLKNGNILEVIKNFVHKCSKNFFYISLKEYNQGKLERSFAIDMDSKGFVKLNRKGESKVQDYSLQAVEHDSVFENCYRKRLEGYVDAIFAQEGKNTTKPEVLKAQAQTKKQAKKITDITIEDLLDEDVIWAVPESISEKEIFAKEKPQKIKNLPKKETKTIKEKPVKKETLITTRTPLQKVKKSLPQKAKAEISNELDIEGIKEANVKPDLTIKAKFGESDGILQPAIQENINEIGDILFDMLKYLDRHKGSFVKIKALKEKYESLQYKSGSKQKVIEFKLEDNATLGVIHTKTSLRFTRFIYKDSEGNETHLLVDNGEKVVRNLNKKTPWIVPMKFKYMTEEQIKASNIDKYAKFIKDELGKYYDYLKTNLG